MPNILFVSYSAVVLGITGSSGIGDVGMLRWELVLCYLAAWVIVYLALINGVKSSGKVAARSVYTCTSCTLVANMVIQIPLYSSFTYLCINRPAVDLNLQPTVTSWPRYLF